MNATSQPPPGLSVIMIGRDEESFLTRTLPPLQQAADEIIFVDTGSSDRTPLLAADAGATVLERPWDDDFSAPKNLALQQAHYRWVLNVDCDEELLIEPHTATFLKEHTERVDIPAAIITIENITRDRRIIPQESMRLFRNDTRIRFDKPIHENVCDAVYESWPTVEIPKEPLRLRHHGYSSGDTKGKMERNIRILKRWVEQDPNTLFGHHKLGMNLSHTGQSKEALHHLEHAFELANNESDKGSIAILGDLLHTYLTLLLEQGMTDRAEAVKKTVESWK
ncbi:MAG: glycosyltransferase family 2 protein [Magnetococcales bacterium]|nr:glycosyltransferase family 2 protein [Magnetococcales bacterium]